MAGPDRHTTSTDLTGRVAIVTGSGRGIGLAIVEELAHQGASVVLNARSATSVDSAAAQLRNAGRTALGVAADVCTEDGAARLLRKAWDTYGRVDVLVNNAGMPMKRDSRLLTLAEWRSTVDTNLTSALLCSQQAAEYMGRGAGGAIVNIGSVTSFNAFPRSLAYATTKAALVMMTRVLAVEWAPRIRVNAVAPGVVATDFTRSLVESGDLDFDSVVGRTPMGRLAEPHEVATGVAFLASDDAAFITGETLLIDGGWIAHSYGRPGR